MVTFLNVRQFRVQPESQVSFESHVPMNLLTLDGDSLTESPTVHSVEALSPLGGKGLLHGLIH